MCPGQPRFPKQPNYTRWKQVSHHLTLTNLDTVAGVRNSCRLCLLKLHALEPLSSPPPLSMLPPAPGDCVWGLGTLVSQAASGRGGDTQGRTKLIHYSILCFCHTHLSLTPMLLQVTSLDIVVPSLDTNRHESLLNTWPRLIKLNYLEALLGLFYFILLDNLMFNFLIVEFLWFKQIELHTNFILDFSFM